MQAIGAILVIGAVVSAIVGLFIVLPIPMMILSAISIGSFLIRISQ